MPPNVWAWRERLCTSGYRRAEFRTIVLAGSSRFILTTWKSSSPPFVRREPGNPMSVLRRTDRRNEWWVDFRYRRKRIRKRSPVQTKRGAEQYERQLRKEFAEDETHGRDPFSAPPPRYRDYVESWMHDYVEPRNRLSGRIEKQSYLKHHIVPAFGELRLNEITTLGVNEFVNGMLNRGLAPKTINNILTTLRCSLRFAVEWGLLDRLPMIRQLAVSEKPFRYLDSDQVCKLIDAARPGFWRSFITLLAFTGLRFGEAAGLHWEDVVLDSNQPQMTIWRAAVRGVIAQTKTGRLRVIPLVEKVVEALDMLPHTNELVFPRTNGNPMRPEITLDVLHRTCDRAGVPRIGWHGLRHSFASTMCQRGVPIRDVQELLGHTTIMMTSRYTHTSPKNLQGWLRHSFANEQHDKNGHQVATTATSCTA